jgi:hypothetical protein
VFICFIAWTKDSFLCYAQGCYFTELRYKDLVPTLGIDRFCESHWRMENVLVEGYGVGFWKVLEGWLTG